MEGNGEFLLSFCSGSFVFVCVGGGRCGLERKILFSISLLLDDIESEADAVVAHGAQVLDVGVGDPGEQAHDRRVRQLGGAEGAAEEHRAGGQNGEDGAAGGQAQVLLRHAVEEEALEGEAEQQDGVHQRLEGALEREREGFRWK